MTLEAFLQTIIADPQSAATMWPVLADWLEDHNDPRHELVRLLHQPDFHNDWPAEQRDERVRELLASGMQPIAPTISNSIGMKLALIPAGAFLMGSPESEEERRDDETQHPVEITQPFFMGVFPVTQEEYQRVVGNNPSHFSKSGGGKAKVEKLNTSRFPVETVSQDDAIAFCHLLSELPEEKHAGRLYRLPTEAEWEYSCRGRATVSKPFCFGDSLSCKQANFIGYFPYGGAPKGQFLQRTCEVGYYHANSFGLFDMHGNVWERCQDWYAPYDLIILKDPAGSATSPENGGVLRGGSWFHGGRYCRSAYRLWLNAGFRNSYFGFRVVCGVRTS